jgi:hypothetical protein
MLISPAKQEDVEFRVSVLKDAMWALERHTHHESAGNERMAAAMLETANSLIALADVYKKRIETHDYSWEDGFIERTKEFARRMARKPYTGETPEEAEKATKEFEKRLEEARPEEDVNGFMQPILEDIKKYHGTS